MKVFVSVDNGYHGGVAVLSESEEILDLYPMPIIKKDKTEYNIPGINEMFSEIFLKHSCDEVHVFLEKAHPRPISGNKQCFITGFGYGIIQAILTSNAQGFELIEPKMWQKEIFKGLNMDDTKQASIMYCKRKYPTTKFEQYGKPFTDGLTDATCIALYGKRLLERR